MAIGVIFEVPGATQQQYDGVNARLGQNLSPGLLLHAAGPVDGGWVIVEVWESEEAQRLFQQQFGQVLQEEGFPRPTARFFPIHNLVRR